MNPISPFSGKETNTIHGKKKNHTIFRCNETGALFFDRKTLTFNDYSDYYPYLIEFNKKRTQQEIDIRKRKTKKQLKKLETLCSGKVLVDVGAGPGYYCKIAKDSGWETIGVEVSEPAMNFGKENYGILYKPFETIDENTADVVICHHVIEHVPDPITFFSGIRKILKKDGIFAIHVPHQQPFDLFLKGFFKKDFVCNLYGNEHINGFTLNSLSRFLIQEHFNPVVKTTASAFSKYYDPFFLNNFLEKKDYIGIFKKFFRQSINSVGKLFNKGTWVIVYAQNKK